MKNARSNQRVRLRGTTQVGLVLQVNCFGFAGETQVLLDGGSIIMQTHESALEPESDGVKLEFIIHPIERDQNGL